MGRYKMKISYKEERWFKRLPILGVALLAIAGLFETVFVFVGQNYLIINIGASLLLTIFQGRMYPTSLITALMAILMAALFIFLLLDQYLFDKFPEKKGTLILLFGIALSVFSYYVIVPAISMVGLF